LTDYIKWRCRNNKRMNGMVDKRAYKEMREDDRLELYSTFSSSYGVLLELNR